MEREPLDRDCLDELKVFSGSRLEDPAELARFFATYYSTLREAGMPKGLARQLMEEFHSLKLQKLLWPEMPPSHLGYDPSEGPTG